MRPENLKRDLDPNNAMEAMNRACQLIEELGAGEVVGGVVDVYTTGERRKTMSVLSRKNTTDCSEQTLHRKPC